MDASAVHSRSIYQSTVTLRLAVIVSSFFHAVFFDTHVLPMFVRRHMASGVAEQSNASCGTRAQIFVFSFVNDFPLYFLCVGTSGHGGVMAVVKVLMNRVVHRLMD
jgi:hypothetical protein